MENLHGKRIKMKKYLISLVVIVSTLALTSCSKNEEVKNGPVFIEDTSITKSCDGTTLIYSKPYAIALIQNSPECK